MKYCTNCGKKINVISPKFCPECGYSFSGGPAPEPIEGYEEEIASERGFSISSDDVSIEVDKGVGCFDVKSLISQGEGLDRKEIYGPKRAPYRTSKLSKEELKKVLISECSKVRESKEVEVD